VIQAVVTVGLRRFCVCPATGHKEIQMQQTTEKLTPKSNRGRKPGYKKPAPTVDPTANIIKARELHLVTGVSRATCYRLEAAGQFPKRRKLTSFSVGWIRSELEAWVASRSFAGEV
jgi:prophage regulatory protein